MNVKHVLILHNKTAHQLDYFSLSSLHNIFSEKGDLAWFRFVENWK